MAKAEGQRIFAAMHNPPFFYVANEDEHYENLIKSARVRLLSLFQLLTVDAVFCWHVHQFFWHQHEGIDFYMIPLNVFMRPEFSELYPVTPLGDFGRDNANQLGFAFVYI